jgi:hypothetical protein
MMDTVYSCTICHQPIADGYMYGDGDGTGRRFAHPRCYHLRTLRDAGAPVDERQRAIRWLEWRQDPPPADAAGAERGMMAEHKPCHGCLDGCSRESAVHCVSCVNEPWPCDAQRLREALADIATRATQGIDTAHGGRILRQIEIRARAALAEEGG